MLSADIINSIKDLSGKSDEEIYQILLSRGYKIADIQAGLENLNSASAFIKPNEPTQVPKTTNNASDSITSIFGIVGGVILGIGILSLVAANWSNISSDVKLILLILTVVGFHLFGIITKYIFKLDKVANSLHLVGSIAFGASLFLVGQIYNLPINWYDAFYIWIIGVGLIGMVLNNFIHEYLALLILSISVTTTSFVGFYSIFALYTYSPVQEFKEYTSLFLVFVTSILLTLWALRHRLSNQDELLRKVF